MRIGLFSTFNLFMSGVLAMAGDSLPVLKAGTNTYTHVQVFKVTATDIYFTSDSGLANVRLKNLDPKLQQHFNYNPTNAAAAELKQKKANNLYHLGITKPSAVKKSADGEADSDLPSAIEPGSGKQIWAKPYLNQPAPPIFVEKWLNGQPDNRGKLLLLDFWATWCPPCRAAIPALNEFQKQFGGHLVVIGLTDEPENVVKKMTDPKIEYTVGIDTQARTLKATAVTGIPHILIIDPHGIVRWEGNPFLKGYELTGKVVASLINQYSN